MKNFISAFLIILILLSFSSCAGKEQITPVSGDIIEAEDGFIVSFTVKNDTGKAVKNLTLNIETYSDGSTLCEKGEAVYPISAESGAKATLTFKAKKECTQAKALSYSFTDEKGEEKSGEFAEDFIAVIKEKDDGEIRTREQLAERIIRDIKSQFLANGSYALGKYDSENKELLIVSKYEQDYDTCAELYEREPDMWKGIEDGIVSMSLSCIEDFKEYNFEDVKVNIGVISKDEQILFMATDGEIVRTPSL